MFVGMRKVGSLLDKLKFNFILFIYYMFFFFMLILFILVTF